MTGLSRHSLRPVTGLDHLGQSIQDILTTPKGTRVMRRDYGSLVAELIDAPVNGQTLIEVYHATAEALDIWEPRLELTRVRVRTSTAGRLDLDLEGNVQGLPQQLSVALEARP